MSKFSEWLSQSFQDGDRTSGKSLSAFALIMIFVFVTLFMLFRPCFFTNDIAEKEYKLLEVCVDGIVWIVLGLYSVKAVGRSKFFSGTETESKQKQDEIK